VPVRFDLARSKTTVGNSSEPKGSPGDDDDDKDDPVVFVVAALLAMVNSLGGFAYEMPFASRSRAHDSVTGGAGHADLKVLPPRRAACAGAPREKPSP
jgi:hypothetical protein